jgi:hypothetical protein
VHNTVATVELKSYKEAITQSSDKYTSHFKKLYHVKIRLSLITNQANVKNTKKVYTLIQN